MRHRFRLLKYSRSLFAATVAFVLAGFMDFSRCVNAQETISIGIAGENFSFLPFRVAQEWTLVSGKDKSMSRLKCAEVVDPWEVDVPYIISMIELAEGVKMWSNVIGCPAEEVRISDPVALVHDDVTDAVTLPKFRRKSS